MYLLAVGLNHKTADLALRERIMAAAKQVDHKLLPGIVVSTCNRLEIYLEPKYIYKLVRNLRQHSDLRLRELRDIIYIHFDLAAVSHLMRVASGLDSAIVGEVEIIGQLKRAYQAAIASKEIGSPLMRLFDAAFMTGKKVRTQTSLGVNPISIAQIAVRVAKRIYRDIREQSFLIFGAGETARLLCQHLLSQGVTKISIANRSLARAKSLAQSLQLSATQAITLQQAKSELWQADIVITALSHCPNYLELELLQRAIIQRKRRPMLLLDLSLPRSIDAQCGEINELYLYNLQDLQQIADTNRKLRHQASIDADRIIDSEARNYIQWLESLELASSIAAFREDCETLRDKSLAEARVQLQAGKDPELVVQRLAHVLVNRISHQPTLKMRVAGMENNKEAIKLIKRLFSNETVDQE